jgi:hypothetical protein
MAPRIKGGEQNKFLKKVGGFCHHRRMEERPETRQTKTKGKSVVRESNKQTKRKEKYE